MLLTWGMKALVFQSSKACYETYFKKNQHTKGKPLDILKTQIEKSFNCVHTCDLSIF